MARRRRQLVDVAELELQGTALVGVDPRVGQAGPGIGRWRRGHAGQGLGGGGLGLGAGGAHAPGGAGGVEELPGVAAGRYAELTIADTGGGMDRATRQRLFEPFFTTKGPGKGTGLGLATVYEIVDAAGGRLVIDSRLGEGTEIAVLLPRSVVDQEAS